MNSHTNIYIYTHVHIHIVRVIYYVHRNRYKYTYTYIYIYIHICVFVRACSCGESSLAVQLTKYYSIMHILAGMHLSVHKYIYIHIIHTYAYVSMRNYLCDPIPC